MRFEYLLVLLFSVVCSCAKVTPETNERLAFDCWLDSVGNTTIWNEKTINEIDSIHKNIEHHNKVLTSKQFSVLKAAVDKGNLDLKTALTIFPNLKYDSLESRYGIELALISFDENETDYNEFAIIIGGWDWENQVYFFKSNKLLTRHSIFHKYGLEFKSFKDSENKTIVYYRYNFVSGTGAFWSNNFFYKYHELGILPALNEVDHISLDGFWRLRSRSITATVRSSNPLAIKMVYSQELQDTSCFNKDSTGFYAMNFVYDSVLITYRWDEQKLLFISNFPSDKLNREKIVSYYTNDDDLLFVNAYYQELKNYLKNGTAKEKACVKKYLDGVRLKN